MDDSDEIVFAAVEGGGTTFVLAVARLVASSGVPEILHRHETDTVEPQLTLSECARFFRMHKPSGGYHALGIATFGPVGLDPTRKATYGHILGSSPKKPWRNVDFLTPLADACRGERPLRLKVETDVNAPAFAEFLLEKGRVSSVAYVTVGTGIGVGLVINGKPVHGRMHPEGGHVPIQPLEDGDDFKGYSWGEKAPFRGKNTVEGMTSSVALTERLEQMTGGKNLPRNCLVELSDDHEIWDHSANALANLCTTLLLTVSVEKIVLGGGIMNRKGLIEKIRKRTVVLLNGYLELPTDMSELISTSSYGNDVGLTGALILAQCAYQEGENTSSSIKEQGSDSAFLVGFIHGVAVGSASMLLAAMILGRRK